MGYTFTMFGVLLIMSVVIVTAVNYGIAKDSQTAPLKAENAYAAKKTAQAQTGLTIVNTCLIGDPSGNWPNYPFRYLNASPPDFSLISGPHILNIIVKDNKSTVLNPNNATVLFNASYTNFTVGGYNATLNISGKNLGIGGGGCEWEAGRWEECEGEEMVSGLCYPPNQGPYAGVVVNAWSPLTFVCMKAKNIFIPTPNMTAPGVPLRLAVLAENGISAIAPTSPTNFSGTWVNGTNYTLTWSPSYDANGIAYYRLYGINNYSNISTCTYYDNYSVIPGNWNSVTIKGNTTEYFYLTAVDTLLNEGVQSRTIKCTPSGCTY